MGHAMFGSSIKAVLAVELPRLKPPPDAIGGCLARTGSLRLARQRIRVKRGPEFLNRLAAVLLSLLPSVLLISGPMSKKKCRAAALLSRVDKRGLASRSPPPLQRIFEEQAARNAQSRREAIDDFHTFSGSHNDFQRIEACHLED